MKRTAALLGLVLLGGCSSYADRVAATCARLGAGPGSPYYWPCVQQQQEIDSRDRAMWGGIAASSVAQPPAWSATCVTMGGVTHCGGR